MKNSLIPRFAKCAGLAVLAVAIAPSAHAVFHKYSSFTIEPTGNYLTGDVGESVASTASIGLIVQAAAGPAHATNVTDIASYIATGYNGGDWLGTGMTSPAVQVDAGINGVLSVMLYDNTLLNYAKWAGALDLDTIPDANFNQVLSRVSYAGDFTGDGLLTADDYGLLDFYFSSSFNAQGDLNGDGIIDAGDYGILDYVLSFQPYGALTDLAAFSGGGKGGGVVPEPGSMALLLSGAAYLLGMRKRKQSI